MNNHNIRFVIKELERLYSENPAPVVDFIKAKTGDPFKILVATILSARTNDTITTKVVKSLFNVITNFCDLEKLSVSEIEKLIYPVGFYKQKAKYLKELPEVIKSKFYNKIPQEIEELVKLPGVGRKTANLVRALAFGKPAICVDVHVHRISNRLGYVKTDNPLQTEMELRKKLPKKYWIRFNSLIVSFGQKLCTPRNPKCNICPIIKYCNKVNVESKYISIKELR